MENSLKGLLLAAGTIITCVVITLGFFISREAQTTANNGAKQINNLNAEFLESNKSMYDGNTVSGSEVINSISKMSNESTGICVKTKLSTTFYNYDFDVTTGELRSKINLLYNKAGDTFANEYINPSAMFSAIVVRNKNQVITGIVFTQV